MEEKRYCPHCEEQLERWEAPPETCWGEILICSNNECAFYRNSAEDIENKGEANRALGCRYGEDPRNNYHPINVLAICPF
jgi:hypothetical protein